MNTLTLVWTKSESVEGEYSVSILQYPSVTMTVDFDPIDVCNHMLLCQAICCELDLLPGTKIDRWSAPLVSVNKDEINESHSPNVVHLLRQEVLERVKWWY